MKRTVRVKLSYLMTIDDDGDDLPMVNVNDAIVDGIHNFVPVGTVIEPGAHLDIAFTRESFAQIRAAWRERNKAK